MIDQQTKIALIHFIVALCVGTFLPPLSHSNVTLTVGHGSGLPGSTGDLAEVSLNNPNDKVKGVQVDVCDVDNFLTAASCEITDRSNGFNCSVNELANGYCRIIVLSLSGDLIEKGTGPIFTIKYNVSENAPGGECRNLNPENIKISDESGNPISPASITSTPGEFCFNEIATTSAIASSTTTTISSICPVESIYGKHSEETTLLKYFRDNVVSKIPEGKEFIKFYYQLSPVIVQMMNEDEEFKAQVKGMIDGVLGLIRGKVE